MSLIDFSKCVKGDFSYHGADQKTSIKYNDRFYLLKFPKKLPEHRRIDRLSYSNSPISEYLGCHIFDSIGIVAQDTLLGTYGNKVVVACEDFIANKDNREQLQLQEFNTMMNSVLDIELSSSSLKMPDISDIQKTFEHHHRLSKISELAQKAFWNMFVVDAFIANFDRHTGNWGYITDIYTGEMQLAPVYDCGSTLFGQLTDEVMIDILKDSNLLNNYTHSLPNAQFLVNGKKISYGDVLSKYHNHYLEEAIKTVVPKIDMNKIHEIVDSVEAQAPVRKDFLHNILQGRYDHIIASAYKQKTKKRDILINEQTPSIADSKTIKTRIESASISEDIKAPSRSDGRNIGNKSLDREER